MSVFDKRWILGNIRDIFQQRQEERSYVNEEYPCRHSKICYSKLCLCNFFNFYFILKVLFKCYKTWHNLEITDNQQ